MDTIDLASGYYVVAYVVDSSKARALSAWISSQGENLRQIASNGTSSARAASFAIVADTTYPIGDYPLLYETTAYASEDPIDVYLNTPNSDSVQARALVSMEASDSKLAMEAAIASGKLAISTSDLVIEERKSKGFWSSIPWWIKVGVAGVGVGAVVKAWKS